MVHIWIFGCFLKIVPNKLMLSHHQLHYDILKPKDAYRLY